MSDMNMAPDQGSDTDQPGAQDDDQNKVCVRIELDTQTGQFTVGIEDESKEGPEGAGAEGAEDEDSEYQMQPARSIDDALRMAKQLLESGGQSSPESDQAFQAGYSGVRGGQ